MNQWIYFGCHKEAGHYTFGEGMRSLSQRYGSRDLSRFDGMLPPQTDTTPYIATVSRLGGWGFTALAFWDYSVDKRGGCNSVVFAPSLTITDDELLAEAQRRFPQVFGRLPQPVRLLSSNAAMSGAEPASSAERPLDGTVMRFGERKMMDNEEFHAALYRERCRREAVETENRLLRYALDAVQNPLLERHECNKIASDTLVKVGAGRTATFGHNAEVTGAAPEKGLSE